MPALLLSGCAEPDLTIGIRIRDFLDTLAEEEFGEEMELHFHPDLSYGDDTESDLREKFVDVDGAEDEGIEEYEWRETAGTSRDATDDYDGEHAVRVSGRVFGRIDEENSEEWVLSFVMRQDGSNWKIRAIEFGDDEPGEGSVR